MDAKELISDLILEKITVSQALRLTQLHFSDSLSKESKQWISDEIDGYKNSLVLPDYRQLDCDLKLEVYDSMYNRIIKTLNTTHINSYLEKNGVANSSPNKMKVSQNIESIEKTQVKESGNIKIIFNDEIKAMVLEWYNHSSYIEFGKLFQECPSANINVILAKVKNILISLLKNEVLTKEKTTTILEKEKVAKKKIFISYSWEEEEHKSWVLKLANRLENSFDIKIDEKLPLGGDINAFMENMIEYSDKILLILTPTYKQKADGREKGVGYETGLISNEFFNDQASIKFVPILRKGTLESSFPKYLGNRKCLVMTDDSKFEENIEILIDDLRNN